MGLRVPEEYHLQYDKSLQPSVLQRRIEYRKAMSRAA